MQPAAHADAELMDNFPSFPLPPPPVPQHGRSSLAHGGASPGPAVGCSGPGRHRGWGTPGLSPWMAPLPWASGWASGSSPGHSIPRRGQRLPPPGGRESRAALPGMRSILPGFTSPLCRGKPRLLLPQSPQCAATPRNTPAPAPDTRYLLTRGPEAAQPPGLQARY